MLTCCAGIVHCVSDMAMSSLRYKSGKGSDREETKKGQPIFDGAPSQFQEWEFRVELRAESIEEGKEAKAIGEVIDGLRGDALQIAMDIGRAELIKAGGLNILVQKINDELVFPSKKLEAKELYAQGHKVGGYLARQGGESMRSYVARRQRWWKTLQEMDKGVSLSEEIRGDLLLDNADLSKIEKLLILTSTNNETMFDAVAEALIKQHAKIHLNERTRSPGQSYKGGGKFRKAFGPRFAAHFGTEEVEEDYDAGIAEEECEGDYDVDGDEEECEYVGNEIESIELETITAFLVAEPEGIFDAGVAETAQAEVVANMAWQRNKGEGKGKGKGKGNGKSKGKSQGEFPVSRNPLSLEERKKKLTELKARTNCQACGERGHWAGDQQCQKKTEKVGMFGMFWLKLYWLELSVKLLRELCPSVRLCVPSLGSPTPHLQYSDDLRRFQVYEFS